MAKDQLNCEIGLGFYWANLTKKNGESRGEGLYSGNVGSSNVGLALSRGQRNYGVIRGGNARIQ
jgi:hypothetical protein